MTAFTIGNRKSYDQALAEDPEVTKLGAFDDYEGGWVWSTAAAAGTFMEGASLPWEGAVYELELPTGWEVDVSLGTAPDGVHRLLNDARILRRVGE